MISCGHDSSMTEAKSTHSKAGHLGKEAKEQKLVPLLIHQPQQTKNSRSHRRQARAPESNLKLPVLFKVDNTSEAASKVITNRIITGRFFKHFNFPEIQKLEFCKI